MLHLQIETLNVCNAACVFCPYPQMERAKKLMPMELFEKIIVDAEQLHQIDHITITGLGEPLLDKLLFDRLDLVNKIYSRPIERDIYTNGTFLRKEKVDRLIELGLDTIYVSLNAVSSEKRLQIMKTDDYDTVLKQIFYAISASEGTTTNIVVKGIQEKDLMEHEECEKFMELFGGPTSRGGRGYLHLEGNWAGDNGKMRTTLTTPCSRALQQIMVLSDGRVSLCCFDGEGRMILGDLKTQTIREVFNGSKALGVREAHWNGRRNEIELCAGCTGI